MKFKEYVELYDVPMLRPSKERHINPKTNREKTFRHQRVLKTKIAPEDRTFKNLPRYANDKPKVHFTDWLLIDAQKRNPKHTAPSFGKSAADGKWWGWSHRAVYGFGIGDRVEGDNGGKKVEYPKLPDGSIDWDNGKYEPDFTIKTDAQAKQCAIRFADSVS